MSYNTTKYIYIKHCIHIKYSKCTYVEWAGQLNSIGQRNYHLPKLISQPSYKNMYQLECGFNQSINIHLKKISTDLCVSSVKV